MQPRPAQTDSAVAGTPGAETASSDPKPHRVRMKWGSGIGGDEKPVSDYEFASAGELNAFLYGCDEANGWLDMEQIDPNPDGSFPEPDANDE